MYQFDSKIQIRANHVARSVLQVAIPAYELKDRLHIGLAMLLNWEQSALPGHEKTIGTLHVRGHLADDTTVFIAEATLHQIAEVGGFSDEDLVDVREVQLPAILQPYMRAQVASLLNAAGYQHVILPADLNQDGLRATPVAVESASEPVTGSEAPANAAAPVDTPTETAPMAEALAPEAEELTS